MRPAGALPAPILRSGLAALLLTGSCALVVAPSAARADTVPADPTRPATVSADALPTVQVDGVVWSQVVVGNTVYAGGQFANARPAGAAPGTSQTPRNNLLAYDIRTGALITSFAPNLNGQVLGLAASPDGSTLYVAGDFTSADGANRYRLAAYDTASGKLISSFAPVLDYRARTIVATATTVYVGGAFNVVNGNSRPRLAAFQASNGALLNWAPVADAQVSAMVLTPDQSKLIVGGQFQNLNGAPALGLAALDPVSGSTLPWAATSVVQDSGANASITSLTTDGSKVYGTGYVFGPGGNLEGTFAADPGTGAVAWVEDCHGDTYSAFPVGGVVYTASHAHYCGNIGGFPETNPRTHHHALAFSANATGTVTPDPYGYYNWAGTPSPSLLPWWPDLAPGTVTGQNQAAWNVTGNGQYVVMGGEFPTVNGTGQQSLVRFAVRSLAPNAQGPMLKGSLLTPTVVPLDTGRLRVSFPADWDRDSEQLTYAVQRDDSTVVWSGTARSTFWNRPTLGFVDTGLAPGSVHRYRISVTDPTGNTVLGDWVSATVSSSTTASPYAADVTGDGATAYWRLGEGGGTASYDRIGYDDLTLGGSASLGVPGALGADTDTAARFSGGSAVSSTVRPGANTFSVEAWFRTTTTSGGKIIGFGDSTSGTSSNYDRHVYMDNAGHVLFGVFPGGVRLVGSAGTYNDGAWHHVVASLGSGGMALWLDGARVGSDLGTTSAQPFSGVWHIGGDNLNGWPAQPSSSAFAGDIDDVAVYPTPLTAAQVRRHYGDSGRPASRAGTRPADAYGATVFDAAPDSYWRLDEAGGATAADASVNGLDAVISGGVDRGVPGALAGAGNAFHTNGFDGSVIGSARVNNPTTYSEELWFSTTTTRGGKLIGFGDNPTGLSNNYDRHVYMFNDGRLRFGVWTGQVNVADSAASYNDGRWHHLVATQGADGMKLYVDGAVVATNPQTQAQPFAGYWHLGGDRTWGGASSDWFEGRLDEAAVYSRALTATEVLRHYHAGGGQANNAAPSAAFSSSAVDLTARFDGSASSDSDGQVRAYAWSFGDGTAAAASAAPTASHAYAAAGTYPVTLTVTDDSGASTSVTQAVTVTAHVNVAPTAAFTSTANGLSATVDGSGSSDSDGQVTAWSWQFGDGTPAASGAVVTHAYASAGTYQVTLTVTDDAGATTSLTRPVTVSPPVWAADSFSRTSTSGFGNADTGGAWAVVGSAANATVSGGVGRLRLTGAGATTGVYLPSVSTTSTDTRVSVSLDSAATGAGTYVSLQGRRSAAGDYRLKLRVQPGGAVTASLGRVAGGTETTLTQLTLPGISYVPGQVLLMRMQVTGSGTTTLNGKVWAQGSAEPSAWTLTTTDSTASLQAAGSVGVLGYASSTSTAPVVVSTDDLFSGPAA